MRVDAEIGAQRKLDTIEDERLLAEQGRGARRRRRYNGVNVGKQRGHLLAITAPEFLRLDHERGGNHCASDQAIAHDRIEIARAPAQPFEVQHTALARGDHVCGGARLPSLGNFDFGFGA